jgi:hypothetical protein
VELFTSANTRPRAFLELLVAVADDVLLVRREEDVLVLLDRELELKLLSSLGHGARDAASEEVS